MNVISTWKRIVKNKIVKIDFVFLGFITSRRYVHQRSPEVWNLLYRRIMILKHNESKSRLNRRAI